MMYADPLDFLNQSIQRDVAAGRMILRSVTPPPISPLGRSVLSRFPRGLDDSPARYALDPLVGCPGRLPYPLVDPLAQAMPRINLADAIIDAEANVVNRLDALSPQDTHSKVLQREVAELEAARGLQKDFADVEAAIGSALVALEAFAHDYSDAMQKLYEEEQNRSRADEATCRLEEVVENHQASLSVLERAVRVSKECETRARHEAEQAGHQLVLDEASEKDSRARFEPAKQQHEESLKAVQEAHEEMRNSEVEFLRAQQQECQALQQAGDAIAVKACAADAMTCCKIRADQTAALALEARANAERNANRYGDMRGLAFAARAESNSSMSKQNMLKAEIDSNRTEAMAEKAQQIAVSTTDERTNRQQDFDEMAMLYRTAAQKERSDYLKLCEWKQKHYEDVCNLQQSKAADALAGQTYQHCKLDREKRENEEIDLRKVCDSAIAALEDARKTGQLSAESYERANALFVESGSNLARQRQRFIHVRNTSGKCLDLVSLRRYDETLRRLDDEIFLQGPISRSQATAVQKRFVPKPRNGKVNGRATETETETVEAAAKPPQSAGQDTAERSKLTKEQRALEDSMDASKKRSERD